MLWLLAPAEAGETLESLLARGEVTLLETRPDGRLEQVTAIGIVPAPVDRVWARLTDFASYELWMPQVEDSTVVSHEGDTWVVDFSIGVVGPNINVRQKLVLDPAARTIRASWVSGALQGSHWEWRLEDRGSQTLAWRTLYTNVVDTNWVVRQIENDAHTMEYGINVATGVVELRGLARALAP